MQRKTTGFNWLREDKLKVFDALLFNGAFLLVIWALWLFDQAEPAVRLNQYGTRPRSLEGLFGIISTPFLHGSFDHIKGNTLSFFTLSSFLIFFYREIAFRILGWLYVCSGILLWVIAQGGNHIGASGVIYGLAAFLFVSGVVRRDPRLLRVSLAVAFLYGSIIWWVLPIEPGISWEGHLSGVIVGAILALVYRNKGPKRRQYRWEEEEEDEEQELLDQEEHPAGEADEDHHHHQRPFYGSGWKSDHTGLS
jgi:membrane associated rhomboid family serine protease